MSLKGLADSTPEPGETAVIQIAFSSGTGSGGGHHLCRDNVAVRAMKTPVRAPQSWRFGYFGTTAANVGSTADDFDADADGESNL